MSQQSAATVEIREATVLDLPLIMKLEKDCFANDAWDLATMKSEVAAKHTYYLCAFEKADLLGYAGISKLPGNHQGDVQTIAVTRAARGRGLGKSLMHALLKQAGVLKTGELFLEVRADNKAAQNLYLSLGFEHINTRKRYYQPDNVDAWVMRLQLGRPE